jgi:hypothetical protein
MPQKSCVEPEIMADIGLVFIAIRMRLVLVSESDLDEIVFWQA